MSVLIQTSLGEIVIDLLTKECPNASKNFLKCDPTNTGRGGESIYGILYGDDAKYFEDEVHLLIKHKEKGVVAMANDGKNQNGSRFYITMAENLEHLDGKHTIFGKVSEGFDVLDNINNAYTDKSGRPLLNIRIKHTFILDDPFPDPPSLFIPDQSPVLVKPEGDVRPEVDEKWDETEGKTTEQLEEELAQQTAKSQATMLEILGDISDANVKPPENVLFVCKLHPVTQEEDLELIFSRFGTIISCEIIRDWKTNDSLQYAFIEFSNPKECEAAYLKMDNVLIDDRRIHVDFSQSVSKLPGDKYSNAFKAFQRGGNKKDVQLKSSKGQNAGTSGYSLVFDHEDEKRDKSHKRDYDSRDKRDDRDRRDNRRDDRDRRDDRRDDRDRRDDKRPRRDDRDRKDDRDKRDDRDDRRRDRDTRDKRDDRDRKDERKDDRRDSRDSRDNRDSRDSRDSRDKRDDRGRSDNNERNRKDDRDR